MVDVLAKQHNWMKLMVLTILCNSVNVEVSGDTSVFIPTNSVAKVSPVVIYPNSKAVSLPTVESILTLLLISVLPTAKTATPD